MWSEPSATNVVPDTIPSLSQEAGRRFGTADAIVDVSEGVRMSFRDLAHAVRTTAASFTSLGVAHGDRVAVWAPNTWQWVVAAIGAQSAGAVLVPLNTRFKGQEAAYVLEKSGAKVLCTVSDFLGQAVYVAMLRTAQRAADAPELDAIVVLSGEAPVNCLSWHEFTQRGLEVGPAKVRSVLDAVGPDDISDIIFTSGTTGAPKGVRTTHRQNLRAYRAWARNVGLVRGDRHMVISPFFHCFGYKAGILTSLLAGATVYPQAVFDIAEVLKSIDANRILSFPARRACFKVCSDATIWDPLTSPPCGQPLQARPPCQSFSLLRCEIGSGSRRSLRVTD